MKITLKRLTLAIAGAGLLTIYGCGGGGGSSTATTGGGGVGGSLNTFAGFAATGAPLAAGVVVVTDATGATVGTTTTATDGSYSLSFNPASFTAPFVVVVTGKVGDAAATLVSVQATNTSATVNMTPITNAIAALLSSTGNPTDLVTNIATEKLNITPTSIATNEQAFRDALAANMTAVGLTPTDNLLSGAFTTQLDKLLDNIHIEVLPSGQIQMSSSAGAAVDDLAATGTQPAAAKTVVLAKGVAPSSANLTNLPAPPATPIGIDVLEAARLALNACFAVPAATPRAITTTECSSLVATGYKHDGRDATAEFVTSKLLTDAGNDGMLFQKPEILRQLSTVSGSERLIVRLNAIRTDGLVRSLTTVAANNGASWELVGNQRLYETFVNGVASKRISANNAANTRLETGLNIYVADNADISSVVVTGPGLPSPAGITLKPKAGCDFLAIDDAIAAEPSYCSSFYRFKSALVGGSSYTGSAGGIGIPSNQYLYGALPDNDIQGIQPLDLYKFVINLTSGGPVTYWNRLRSRPLTPTELATVKFVDYSAATIAQMTTATLYTGGTPPTINWTVPTGGPRPYRAYFFHQAGSDYRGVPFASNSATIPCTSNADCANDGVGPAYNTGLTTHIGGYQFQTVARNRYDTQVFTQLAK